MEKPPTYTVRLVIRGENVDPDEITRRLAATPTRAYRRGDPVDPRFPERRHSIGLWILESGLSPSSLLSEHLSWFTEQVRVEARSFCVATASHETDLVCTIEPNGPSSDDLLDPATLAWLAERRIRLAISVYAFTPAQASDDLGEFMQALDDSPRRTDE